MALLPIGIACVLSAGAGPGDYGARICDAVDDLNADVAFGYAGGCALDADAWRDRLVSIHDRHARLRNALTAAEAAWRNGRDRAARNTLDNFYRILRERPGVGPAAWRPGESAANAYKVLGLDDRIAIEARARPDPAGGFRFEPGGTVTIEAEGASHTLTIQSGSLGLTTNEETDPRTVPTEFVLVLGLRGGGLDALLRLDPRLPAQRARDRRRRARAARRRRHAGIDRARAGPPGLGAFWMVLPVERTAAGGLRIDTAGPVDATDVFPLQPATVAVLIGDTGALNTLPTGREQTCADADGNAIPDGADELIHNNRNLAGRCR